MTIVNSRLFFIQLSAGGFCRQSNDLLFLEGRLKAQANNFIFIYIYDILWLNLSKFCEIAK
jgi:hypothetical protein